MRYAGRTLTRTAYIALMCIWAAVVFTACDGDGGGGNGTDGNGNGIPAICNTVEITSNVTSPTTWLVGNVYVIRKWDFYIENTLVLQPGVVVKFHPTDGPYAMLGGSGTIVANGTSSTSIVFTSYKDDDYCGDTNGDGTATTPAANDWVGIDTNGNNGSVFNYARFYYGGDGSYDNTLYLSAGSQATVVNSTFAHNDGSSYGVLDASDASEGTIIKSNVFYDNSRPLYINTEYSIDDSNVFHNPSNASQTNTYNGIFLSYPDDIDSNISWRETEVAFVIDDSDLWVESGSKLTLGNNVVLKFMSESVFLLADGETALVNHGGSGVYFTSYKDDNHKGDTNGDGPSNGAANDWEGIYDDSGITLYPYFFFWSNILYDSY